MLSCCALVSSTHPPYLAIGTSDLQGHRIEHAQEWSLVVAATNVPPAPSAGPGGGSIATNIATNIDIGPPATPGTVYQDTAPERGGSSGVGATTGVPESLLQQGMQRCSS